MAENKKFRLRLNLFDGIVLILALAVGAVLLWSALKPSAAPEAVTDSSATIRYTVLFQRWLEGTSSAVHEGDRLTDSIRNYEMGRVVSAEARPAQGIRLDHQDRAYVLATMEGYEDVIVTVEATVTVTSEAVTTNSGYVVRVGAPIFVQGDGYLATGYVIAMEREG